MDGLPLFRFRYLVFLLVRAETAGELPKRLPGVESDFQIPRENADRSKTTSVHLISFHQHCFQSETRSAFRPSSFHIGNASTAPDTGARTRAEHQATFRDVGVH